MRLQDFTLDDALNALRTQMGATELGAPIRTESGNRLTMAELETLITGGIDIQSLDEIRGLEDGTLAYKDRRVVLYIRDVSEHVLRRRDGLPRFHVSNCFKLKEMRENKKMGRYVVAARNDGQFQLNVTGGSGVKTTWHELVICQYCLGELGYQGFHHDLPREQRHRMVREFTLQRFFELWPRDLIDADGMETPAFAKQRPPSAGRHATSARR